MKIWIFIFAVVIAFAGGWLLHKPKVVEKVTTVTKVEYKDRVVNKDRVIDRVVTVKTDGTIVTTEHEVVKDRIVEKEVIKEKEKEVLTYRAYEWMISANYMHINSHPDPLNVTVSKRIFDFLYVGIGYSILLEPNFINPKPEINIENFSVSVSILF